MAVATNSKSADIWISFFGVNPVELLHPSPVHV